MIPMPDHPTRVIGQSFADHQREMAHWLGFGGDVDAMNSRHDATHRALAAWLDLPSLALLDGAGQALTQHQRFLAGLEECAVLHLSRYVQHAGHEVPDG